ncbi:MULTISPECIES: TetR family transcriptional regulator [unclassified Acidovorax]|jgi:TetR/AcrR family transcriptional regulator, acrAB operon repressor|uniref:TetR family transcriptional regulator n=1 Tax=unclassified Acidovorax TaxID=2684926 RepID=UPI000BC41114|nr:MULTISPECIES: TetR family transcriptional regulator [unclassified Acidovorax]OYX11368.1 MAG: TetR family transcriptional regulator [Acidovorax sp. 32-64-7]OZA55120.1 MAG: TetR family transcriptional regulator [Acidovorax sp. 17-64-282]HQS20002.1 TetR family transcriptional regulator [Acidovorax defluvii]OYY29540.1 MAG: TetR family transcriptional regulator [Acidovorax sp. 35-64-16]OYY84083.1 MAG: TetR family transcriptional regulator [Acidovorax sp. 28-64-14]
MARRTKADAQTTRNNLLDAAEQLFQSRGVSHTSLNDIATAAGTTRGAIYWHFKDKADLFNAMMERVTLPLEQTLVVAYVEQSAHPVAEIRSAMLEALRLIATDEQTCRVLKIATHQVEYTTDMGAVLERHLSVHGGCVARNHAALQRAFAARGQPPPMALDFAARGLQVLVEGLVHQWLLNTEAFDLQANGRAALDVYLRGLGLHDTVPG